MKKFVQIYHFLIRSLSAGQKFISLLLNYKVLSVQLGIVLGLLLINANYYTCLDIKAATTSTLEEVINPSYLDINSSTGSVQFNSPIKQVNTTSEIQVSAAPQLQQLNINPLLQVITVPPLLRSNSDYEKTGTDQPTHGDGWRFDPDKGILTLDSTLAEPKTKQNQDGSWTTIWPWDNLRPQVKSVDIKSEIKVTNTSSMFAQMPQLSTVNGLNNFTDKIEYMNSMFYGDSSLTSIDASQLKLDSVIQCAYMFDGCEQLKSLDVSNWNVGNVKNFSSMFAGCTNLTSIKGLDGWNTGASTDMASMFAYDVNLTSLNLANSDKGTSFNTSNVTTFNAMFAGCTNLTSITGISNWKNSKATDMSSMFAYDTALETLDLSNFTTPAATYMSSMFASNENLSSLDLSNFDTSNVTTFESMFKGCSNLTSITGISNWKNSKATNMSSMFAYDKALETLDLSNFTTPVATKMDSMFASNETLSSLNLSNFDTSNVTTFNAMFFDCKKLTSITGISNWKNSKATDMSSMFAYDSSLQKLDLSGFDTRNATQDNFFSGDTNLWYLKIGKDTKLKDDCGLPEAPKDKLFPSNQELPMKYKTSQNGKWQKGTNTVVDKTGAFCWWYPNDEMYTADEIKKYSQKDRDNGELFIWQPAFNQSKGSLVLTVSPSQINFDIILDTNNNILGNNNKSSYLAEANSDLEYTVQNPKGESWQLYAMMTKFKKKSNSDSEINSGAMSLSLNEGSENGKQHPLNQQPTSIRTSADNSLEWALKPVLNINIGGLNVIPKAGSSYTTTIDYDLVNSIQ